MGALRNYLLGFGAVGLFAIALVDSALLPLPGGPDAILLLMSILRPSHIPLYVLCAAAGSTVGSFLLYEIGRRGGKWALSQFDPNKRERVHALMSQYDLPAVFFAVLLPPPFPTKIFILTAGVLMMNVWRFSLGAFAGRLLRFSIEGFLAARYGSRTEEIIRGQSWKLGLSVLLVLGLASIAIWLKRRSKPLA